MRKTFVVAAREYSAAVKTKTFLLSLLIMPILMGGSALLQHLLQGVHDTKDKHFVIVDRTPGAVVYPALEKRVELYNKVEVNDPETGKQVRGAFVIESEPPAADSRQQRYELSERVRKGELFGFLEIGPEVLKVPALPRELQPGKKPKKADESVSVRYHSNHPTFLDFTTLAEQVINVVALEERAPAPPLKVKPQDLVKAASPVPFSMEGLSTKDSRGDIHEATEQGRVAPFLVPFFLTLLMFMVVMMSATPLMQGVVEEKMQRIAEVLLGSVSPFQLMFGKLIGMTAVSLTIVSVYLGGAYWAAHQFKVDEFISPGLILVFLVFQALAALMFGSLFIAVGAACSDMKETQNLLLPVMLLACVPMFVLTNVLTEPNGPVATGVSFFPFATPMLMTARMTIPPGIPWWQPVLGGALVLATTVLCVFAAGRIFRVGILMQGKGARLGELARWVLRG